MDESWIERLTPTLPSFVQQHGTIRDPDQREEVGVGGRERGATGAHSPTHPPTHSLTARTPCRLLSAVSATVSGCCHGDAVTRAVPCQCGHRDRRPCSDRRRTVRHGSHAAHMALSWRRAELLVWRGSAPPRGCGWVRRPSCLSYPVSRSHSELIRESGRDRSPISRSWSLSSDPSEMCDVVDSVRSRLLFESSTLAGSCEIDLEYLFAQARGAPRRAGGGECGSRVKGRGEGEGCAKFKVVPTDMGEPDRGWIRVWR